MKLVISPSKALDFKRNPPTQTHTKAVFLNEATQINVALKTKSAKDLSNLMHISDALGQLNFKRNQSWQLPFSLANARQAIYAFNGDVYKGFDAYTIEASHFDKLSNTVRILSGLYGILKPFDLIQPYRLEMGTKFSVKYHKNLYEFWKENITKSLNTELQDKELFVNLASQEYFKAIDKKALKVPVINVHFKEFKNGTYKNIAIFAKKARGLMARYIIDTNAETLVDIKGFNYDRYGFSESLSSENELVFVR